METNIPPLPLLTLPKSVELGCRPSCKSSLSSQRRRSRHPPTPPSLPPSPGLISLWLWTALRMDSALALSHLAEALPNAWIIDALTGWPGWRVLGAILDGDLTDSCLSTLIRAAPVAPTVRATVPSHFACCQASSSAFLLHTSSDSLLPTYTTSLPVGPKPRRPGLGGPAGTLRALVFGSSPTTHDHLSSLEVPVASAPSLTPHLHGPLLDDLAPPVPPPTYPTSQQIPSAACTPRTPPTGSRRPSSDTVSAGGSLYLLARAAYAATKVPAMASCGRRSLTSLVSVVPAVHLPAMLAVPSCVAASRPLPTLPGLLRCAAPYLPSSHPSWPLILFPPPHPLLQLRHPFRRNRH
ncbi:hypothetical protein B0T11DRAFT_12258 [Plectosphaerella cucumerina]|uniref:Uncharacterized protein n=1 Tax=Plectosphaerella cucumerina TaxID=40658 RepID=A0A8K0TPL3_9PEZI|nr:hypothetical protein B0T11DRAFT_12258 [Plectosphaerella cucumerina]